MPTVQRILDIAPTSGYLASIAVARGKMYKGEVLDPSTPIWIFIIYKILNTIYEEDNDYDGAVAVANYLYTLLAPFYFEASAIVDGGGGGNIPDVTPSVPCPSDLDFLVSDSSFIATGETEVLIPQFEGYQVDFSRGGIIQNTTILGDGSSYYQWNAFTGLFTIHPAATEGELFRIMVDCSCGGTSSSTSSDGFTFIVTSADFEADGVTLIDDRIPGNSVVLFANNFTSNFLVAPTDFIYVSGGIEIVADGFDANSFNYTIVVSKIS